MRPFTEKQVELVATFADQAVIAIENVRLFEAEQQRTHELTESLEQQTATSEILQVICSSPENWSQCSTTMLANAARICSAKFGNIYLWDGDAFQIVGWPQYAVSVCRSHASTRHFVLNRRIPLII